MTFCVDVRQCPSGDRDRGLYREPQLRDQCDISDRLFLRTMIMGVYMVDEG